MYKIYHLENVEANIVEKLIEVYQLPLEFVYGPDEGVEWDSDYIYNTDTNENLWLEDGIDYILEAINDDDRELFQSKLEEWEQVEFLRLCAELGVTTETIWKNKDLRLNIPEWQKRIVLPLKGVGKNGEVYKLVAMRNNSAPGHDEMDIWIENQNKVVVQDIVVVEQAAQSFTTDPVKHIDKEVVLRVFADEYFEDPTDTFHIKVYDDGEETTNY